jgi:hypothetical protein
MKAELEGLAIHLQTELERIANTDGDVLYFVVLMDRSSLEAEAFGNISKGIAASLLERWRGTEEKP